MISINKGSISHINSSIPSLPSGICGLGGTQLPNGDLVVCGYMGGLYLHYKEGSNQWTTAGSIIRGTTDHSSVWIDGRLLTTGGQDVSYFVISRHEEFSLDGGVKERKKMPIELSCHTATIFDQNKIIVCGGIGQIGNWKMNGMKTLNGIDVKVSKPFLKI